MNELWKKFTNKIRLQLVTEPGGTEMLDLLEELMILKYSEEKQDDRMKICRLMIQYKGVKHVIYRYEVNEFVDLWNYKSDGVTFEGNVIGHIVHNKYNGEILQHMIDEFIKKIKTMKK